MFEIEKNVEMPKGKYPWHKMEVGDSVLIPSEKNGLSARASARTFGTNSNRKFVTRKVEGGVRIWRIE